MAGVNIFRPFLGKNLTVTIQPLTVAADGATSNNGSVVVMRARMAEIAGGRTETTVENVTPMDCFGENEVPIGDITRYSITEIQMALASAISGAKTGGRLARLVGLGRYFKFIGISADNAASPVTFQDEQAICMWTNYDPTYSRGNAKTRLEFQTVPNFDDAGAYLSNPTVVLT